MRHVYVNARLTPTEKSMIEAEASRRDKSPSAYAGDLLRGALAGEMTVEAGPRRYWPPPGARPTRAA
jgi:hypothetical protein